MKQTEPEFGEYASTVGYAEEFDREKRIQMHKIVEKRRLNDRIEIQTMTDLIDGHPARRVWIGGSATVSYIYRGHIRSLEEYL